MTIAQFNAALDGKTIEKDIVYILASENTKITTLRFPKIELDEDNNLLKAYILNPNSKEDNPIYNLSFVISIESIIAIQFKNDYGNDLYKNITNSMMTDY